jgi:hypothetical protein
LPPGIFSIAGFCRVWELKPDYPEAANSPCGRKTKKIRRKPDIKKAPAIKAGAFSFNASP